MVTAKERAAELFQENYAILFEYGGELSEEIVISLLSKKFGVKQCDDIINHIKSNHKGYKDVQNINFYKEVKQCLLEL
jgi:hypothetical protein